MAEADIDTLGDIDFEGRFLMTSPTLLDYTGAKANLANVPTNTFLAKAVAAGLLKADLTNFEAAAALLALIDGGAARSAQARAKDRRCVLDYGGATFLQKLQAAVTDAGTAGGEVFVPAGSYTADTSADGPLTNTGSNVEVVSPRHGAYIAWAGSGTHIVVGGATTQSQRTTFRGLYMEALAGRTLVQTRYARGIRFTDCKIIADGFLRLGDSSLDTAHATYIVELFGCELNRPSAGTCSKHYVDCLNFEGQWVSALSFYEGASTPGLYGFHVADNIQAKIDDVEWVLGYWSRDDINIDWTDGRVVNAKLHGLHSELALSHALKCEVSSSTSKDKTHVGCEGVEIIGGRWDSIGETIHFRHNRDESGVESIANVSIISPQITGATGTKTPILLESLTANSHVATVNVQGVNGYFNPADASQDMVRVVGNSTSGAMADVKVDGINGESRNATALRSALRVEGTGNKRVSHGGNVSAKNAALRVDDQSGVCLRNGWIYKSDTESFGTVASGASVAQSFAVAGVFAGDYIIGLVVGGSPPAGVRFDYLVGGTDSVTITCKNPTAGSLTANSVQFLLRIKPADL